MARCTKVGAPSLETELRLRLPLVKWPPALIDEWQRSFNISLVDSEDGVIIDGLAAACDSAVDDLGNGTKMGGAAVSPADTAAVFLSAVCCVSLGARKGALVPNS